VEAVYIFHNCHLSSTLLDILLVDADSIEPYYSFRLLLTKSTHDSMGTACYLDCMVIEEDTCTICSIAPAVANCFIFLWGAGIEGGVDEAQRISALFGPGCIMRSRISSFIERISFRVVHDGF